MVDAAATAMAATWINLGTQSAHTLAINENTAIPDNNATGIKENLRLNGRELEARGDGRGHRGHQPRDRGDLTIQFDFTVRRR